MMTCQACKHGITRVLDTRETKSGIVRRRRQCNECGNRFSTYEIAAEAVARSIDFHVHVDVEMEQGDLVVKIR